MGDRDVDTIGRRAVDDPRRATESVIDDRRFHGPSAGLGSAGPALLMLGCDDKKFVAGRLEREDQFMEEDRANPVVVGDEKFHQGEVRAEYFRARSWTGGFISLADWLVEETKIEHIARGCRARTRSAAQAIVFRAACRRRDSVSSQTM